MKYNYIEIGERVRHLRKEQGKSQDEFLDDLKEKYKIKMSRNRLSEIENGDKESFSFDFFLAISQEFECDIGYLLGEYNAKTQNNSFICNKTGLTEESIHKLEYEKDNSRIEQFNKFILEPVFWETLEYFEMYKNISNEIIEEQKRQSQIFWEQRTFATDDNTKQRFERAAIALDGKSYDYSMRRYKCILAFEKIVNKFLPRDKY